MKNKKVISIAIAMVLSLSLFTGCGDAKNKEQEQQSTSGVVSTEEEQTSMNIDENEETANQLLTDLKGSYQELWPVVLGEDYNQIWLNESAAIVGEENAQAAVDKMQSMVTGEMYGEEAVATYTADQMAYDCAFIQNVEKFTFDGNTISGTDSDGNEVFSHTYHYVGMEEIRGLYEYESDDADSGEFTYFCIAPDTSETTYHIEFRYGSNLEDLGKYDAGPYAYWLASGISVDYDQAMAENSIKLFCTENLSE